MGNDEVLTDRPWLRAPLQWSIDLYGFLGPHEGALFYHLAAAGYRGEGAIVDAGSFLGKSAFCFAKGLAANPRAVVGRHWIHCFDNFLVNERTTESYLREGLGLTRQIGDSLRDVFDRQVAPVQDWLKVHHGDFFQMEWTNGPIEILMVDIAKSEALMARVMAQFVPHLIEGQSLVVHQDYHGVFHTWVPVVMELLADHFELVEPRVDYTAVFRYTKRIPDALLAKVAAYDFTVEEELQLLDGAIRRLPDGDRHYVELMKVMVLSKTKDVDAIRLALAKAEQQVDKNRDAGLWWSEFVSMSAMVEEHLGWHCYQQQDWQGSLRCAETVIQRRGLSQNAVFMKGSSMLQLGRPVEAEAFLSANMDMKSAPGWSFLALADARQQLGRHADALQALLIGAGIRGEPHGPSMRAFADRMLLLAANVEIGVEQARWALTELERSRGEDPEFWVLQARATRRFGIGNPVAASLAKAASLGLAGDRLQEVQAELAG